MGALTPEIIGSTSLDLGQVLAFVLASVVVIELVAYVLLVKVLHSRYALPFMLLAPAAVGLAVLLAYPFFYAFALSFSNMSTASPARFRTPIYSLVNGLANFRRVFVGNLLQTAHSTFWVLFFRTVLWTVINLVFHVGLGLFLAILLNRPMALRGVYRALLVFPWAMPQVVVALAWRTEFHYQYGFVNTMLGGLGLPPVQWLSNPFWAFVAMCIVNIWLGIPFMMVIILGGLQSIPQDFYEAAEIDGATPFQRFRAITWPLLQPVLTPAVVLGTIWTFNNFNVVFLVTQGAPQETTNILVTALYRAAFDFGRFGFSAAFSVVLFIILVVFATVYIRLSGGLKGLQD